MAEARFSYSWEYQGNAPKLVYTPLTDRCYLTLTQVGPGDLHLHLTPVTPLSVLHCVSCRHRHHQQRSSLAAGDTRSAWPPHVCA